MSDFVHLHLHTLYSLLDGAIRIKDLLKTVQEKGMKSVAITDHGNLFGAIDFYKKAKEAGVKPIIGYEAYVAGPKGRKDKSERIGRHLILLAKNEEGYHNLRYLSSMAFVEGYYYDPRIDKDLLRSHSKGLVGLSACLAGEIPRLVRSGDLDGARNAAREYRDIFEPGSFFLEVQSNGMKEQDEVNTRLAELAETEGIPLAATADSHYVKRGDARAHEVLMCIASGKTFQDPKRLHHDTDGLYITGAADMEAALPDYKEAIANTARIAEMCNVELKLGKNFLPRFQLPEGYDENEYIKKLAVEGLDRRFGELATRAKYPVDRDLYRARLEFELKVIQQMGFSGYFLIVQDFINWAKQHAIPVGPGRGSGAGSIVAYSLRITDLDPIPYNLLFERFLNPERVSMPDFDVDFCQNRRDEVIHYVAGKYGKDNVGQIITFGSLKARSVIRDVVRVMGLPFSEGDRIAKLVPEPVQGKTPPLAECIEMEPRLKQLMTEPQVVSQWVDPAGVQQKVTTKDLLEIAMALEGLHRQPGLHAAGVVIADRPLWEYVPLYKAPDSDALVSQFAKDEVEAAGLVKFDFLGLKTLTVIDDAIRLIKKNHPERKDLAADLIPIDDPAVYELISRGDTAGVFQMESSGFTEMVMKMKPSRFEDVIAAGALYRPGPLDQKLDDGRTMVDVYIDRKNGKDSVSYPHEKLEPILKDTYGVIVYQEQVMQISQVLGGYSLGRADLLRRAMGKKKIEVMAKERVGFLQGCSHTGVDVKIGAQIFDLMEKFAQYGFNKSHSAAYGLVMAALFTSEASNTDKIVAHISQARASGIEVLPPDVNESDHAFGASASSIRFGLSAVKGVGDSAIEAILAARTDGGRFQSLFDFCGRVDGRRINKKVVEALVRSGAFDFEGLPRWRLFGAIDAAVAAGASAAADRASGQKSLFGGASEAAKPRYPKAGDLVGDLVLEEWTERTRLAFEKEALGFYITGHPLEGYEGEVRRYASSTCAQISQKRTGDKVVVVGVVASLRERMKKETGARFGFATLEDLAGTVEVVCWSGKPAKGNLPPVKGYSDWESLLKSDEPLLVQGSVRINDMDPDNPRAEITALEIQPLSQVRTQKTNEVALRIDADKLASEITAQLKTLLGRFPGHCAVTVRAIIPSQTETTIATPFKVSPTDELIESARRLGFAVELH
jgi:DNA polymerase-3 subunit alpha